MFSGRPHKPPRHDPAPDQLKSEGLSGPLSRGPIPVRGHFPKLLVAGSNPVARSKSSRPFSEQRCLNDGPRVDSDTPKVNTMSGRAVLGAEHHRRYGRLKHADATIGFTRLSVPSFSKIACTCAFTVPSEMASVSAISRLRSPRARTCRSSLRILRRQSSVLSSTRGGTTIPPLPWRG